MMMNLIRIKHLPRHVLKTCTTVVVWERGKNISFFLLCLVVEQAKIPFAEKPGVHHFSTVGTTKSKPNLTHGSQFHKTSIALLECALILLYFKIETVEIVE
jgi:hypothetical protein